MLKIPYIDAKGIEYRYGEFFPMEFSPHEYNESFAHMFFPKTKEHALSEGLKWKDIDAKEYAITMQISDIPDHIKDASDSILNETIKCSMCVRGFRIIHQELQFLRKNNLPLPRSCAFCRIEAKIKLWVKQMTLGERVCDKCGKTFRTHYREQDAPKIYCKECYNTEIL